MINCDFNFLYKQNNKCDYRKSNNPAFTIVELLVVIVVIGILAAITIVSYSGITNRATISSLQSDLTNASTTLKLDYVSNGTFPATLASANGGKGITQSQTLDNIIYIPDNTSNPNNFCLQYRKGTNTYAVDGTSAVSSGVCLQNLVSNGDFSSGGSGWWVGSATGGLSIINNAGCIIPTSQYGNMNKGSTDGYLPHASHKMYFAASAKVDRSNIPLYLNDGTTQIGITPTVYGSFQFVSAAMTIAASPADLFIKLQDNNTSGWTSICIDNAIVIDLTTTFGAGNEPTKAQMDTIMNSYPNSWFNIVAKANL